MSNDATVEMLGAMAPGITASARLLLPEDRLDVISYTCNSGAMVIGEEGVMAANCCNAAGRYLAGQPRSHGQP